MLKTNELKISKITKPTAKQIVQWNELWNISSFSNYFNSYQWYGAYLKTYGEKGASVYFCYKSDKLVGIVTFVKTKVYGIPTLATPKPEATDFSSLLLKESNNEVLDHMIEEIGSKNNIVMTKVPDKLAYMLKQMNKNVIVSAISVNSYIDLGDKVYFSKRFLEKIRSIKNKNKDSLELKKFTGNLDLEKLFATIIKIEQESSKKLNNKDIFDEKDNISQFKNILESFRENLLVYLLYHNGKPIAYYICVREKDLAHEIHTAYLYEYRNMNPGKLLFMMMMPDMMNSGLKRINFGFELSGLHPDFSINYDIFIAKNKFIGIYWKLINFTRRTKQKLFGKRYPDKLFLFRRFRDHPHEVADIINKFGNWKGI